MTPIACESRIQRVVVHARGAVVTRVVSLPRELPSETCELVLPAITRRAEPASFRAIASGGREVASVLARFVIPDGPARKGQAVEQVRTLELERDRLSDARAHAAGRRNLLAGLGFDLGMNKRLRQANPRQRIEDALAMSRLAREELGALDAQIAKMDAAIADNQREIEAARLAESQARAEEREGASRPTLACQVRLAAGAGALEALTLEYVVLAARWWPTYKAWLTKGATLVRLELDALVAQDSGEDWSDVELALSTADLVQDARLPELGSLRWGRAQPAQKRGYRPPPQGLEAMFEAYDGAMARLGQERDREEKPMPRPARPARPASAPPPPPPGYTALSAQPGYGPPPSLGSAGSYNAPPPPPPQAFAPSADMPAAMPMAAAPMPKPAMASSIEQQESKKKGKSRAAPRGGAALDEYGDDLEGGGGGYAAPAPAPLSLEPDDTWLDFDALVLGRVDDRPRRGRLARLPEDASRGESIRAREAIYNLSSPARTQDPLYSRGRFDHHYEAEGRGEIPSNARPHRVHVLAKEGPASARFRSVPRESTDVYRESRIENPFGAPLLSGPVDVFLEGALVTTTEVGAVDRGGMLVVGLGVEERLRVARNARVEESTAGLLGGTTHVDHQVTVDLSSSLGMPVTVEVLERIPVTEDKDLSIKVTSAEPEPEVYDQSEIGSPVRGGRRFRVEVPAGGKSKIVYAYRVKLPAKSEIVGGNRRE